MKDSFSAALPPGGMSPSMCEAEGGRQGSLLVRAEDAAVFQGELLMSCHQLHGCHGFLAPQRQQFCGVTPRDTAKNLLIKPCPRPCSPLALY